MLSSTKKELNTLPQKVSYAYRHNYRRIICVSTGLTILLCKISLQFCSEFIDNNRSNIILTRSIARFIKLPTSILYVAHSTFTLQSLIEDYKDPKKRQLAKIIGKSANLVSSTIGLLMQTKIIHLFADGAVDHIRLVSTVLFLFIAEPISYYYAIKKYQDSKGTDKYVECRKSLMISTLTFSLGLVGFIVDHMDLPNIPINLGNGIVYNFNVGVTISIIYSAVLLMLQVEKLFSQPIPELEDIHHESINGLTHNSCDGVTISEL
ncbi:hypothetical protein [Wolbachia endosymbiont of Folsomia candida]|uniref:hypothetical protein n=1 Tax=Wolbachia endosymbiont of Folsomia candida TaxID=169402 RepID=UPI000A756E82|nr:hypothetical protein [Wolbachia endosymbiont of Folsomia candida]APR98278.1 hypothetical protein ASM33_03160 [Wolbachia endosymbiont of Folsomia candida]